MPLGPQGIALVSKFCLPNPQLSARDEIAKEFEICGHSAQPESITLIAAASAVAFTQIAFAADLPRKAPAYSPPPPLVYNWTGFYIGGNVGYSWGRLGNSLSVTNGTPGYFAAAVIPGVNASGTGGLDDNSFTGGLQLGYNFQSGQFVYGFEGDINWMRHDASYGGAFPYSIGGGVYNLTVSNSIDWLATIRGRIGMPVGATGSTLLYVTGGTAPRISAFGGHHVSFNRPRTTDGKFEPLEAKCQAVVTRLPDCGHVHE
jgi:hypothetical protein